MTGFFQFAILGLGLSAVYSLLGVGIVLIYRGSGVVNFAHGTFALAGAIMFTELRARGVPLGVTLALTLAAVSSHAGAGAVLLAAYALGLGLPFVLAALLYASLPDMGRRMARFAVPAARAGGVLVAALGVLLLSGQYSRLTSLLASLSVPHGG